MWHWYIPDRIEDTASVETFPIPSRYRKAIGTLAAAFVQYSRYLDGPGSRLINFYNVLVEKVELNQSERTQEPLIESQIQWHGEDQSEGVGDDNANTNA